MKTCLLFKSSLPAFAGSFCGICFVWGQGGGHASVDGLGLGGAFVAASLGRPSNNRFMPLCKSFHEQHAIVTHQAPHERKPCADCPGCSWQHDL